MLILAIKIKVNNNNNNNNNIQPSVHPSLRPSLSTYLGPGYGGNSLSRYTQTFISPDTSSSSPWGITRRSYSRSSVFQVSLWVSSQGDTTRAPPECGEVASSSRATKHLLTQSVRERPASLRRKLISVNFIRDLVLELNLNKLVINLNTIWRMFSKLNVKIYIYFDNLFKFIFLKGRTALTSAEVGKEQNLSWHLVSRWRSALV